MTPTDLIHAVLGIAGPLPPKPGTGWAREDVRVEDPAGKHGDYAVGASYSARYTYTLPCDTRRLCADVDQYIEELTERTVDDDSGDREFGIIERTEVREERREHGVDGYWQEVATLESSHESHAYIYPDLETAEAHARSFALKDIRGMLHASPHF